jgi:hypothetical protein
MALRLAANFALAQGIRLYRWPAMSDLAVAAGKRKGVEWGLRDSNPHVFWTQDPKSCASANSAKPPGRVSLPPLGFRSPEVDNTGDDLCAVRITLDTQWSYLSLKVILCQLVGIFWVESKRLPMGLTGRSYS